MTQRATLAVDDVVRAVIAGERRIIVVDVEATCWKKAVFSRKKETIEIGAVLLLLDRAESRWPDFQTFVRPRRLPHLSRFCRELTGICQENVDVAPTFPEALRLFSDPQLTQTHIDAHRVIGRKAGAKPHRRRAPTAVIVASSPRATRSSCRSISPQRLTHGCAGHCYRSADSLERLQRPWPVGRHCLILMARSRRSTVSPRPIVNSIR